MTILRSIAAVLAGLVFIVATHMGADEAMHALGVFPPKGEPMFDPGQNALAFAYRAVFSVLGSALTARLAPQRAMGHALTLGAIGTVLASLGAYATIPMNLGPCGIRSRLRRPRCRAPGLGASSSRLERFCGLRFAARAATSAPQPFGRRGTPHEHEEEKGAAPAVRAADARHAL